MLPNVSLFLHEYENAVRLARNGHALIFKGRRIRRRNHRFARGQRVFRIGVHVELAVKFVAESEFFVRVGTVGKNLHPLAVPA